MSQHVLHVLALAAHGPGLSGGDRIFIELARRWATDLEIVVHVEDEGLAMCQRNRLTNVAYRVLSVGPARRLGFAFTFLFKAAKACATLPSRLVSGPDQSTVLSASEFWPDSLPAFLAKARRRDIFWIASWYQFAPSPLRGFDPHERLHLPRFRELAYAGIQVLVLPLIMRFADMVFVTNDVDRQWFISKGFPPGRVIAVRGGVDLSLAVSIPEPVPKDYDAVFIGRLHPQKGVLQLLDIWKKVCGVRPSARLALIGDGPLEGAVKVRISDLNLEGNVVMLGFKDGEEKVRIFKNSWLVVHPAVYDSGGMAACEAMACGLPAVSFDLESLKSYYPKGMLKTPCFDHRLFAENVLALLTDNTLYHRTQQDALEWAQEWDWDRRADELLKRIRSCL